MPASHRFRENAMLKTSRRLMLGMVWVTAGLLLAQLGCDRAPGKLLLDPGGSAGGAGYKSKFTRIQVAGNLNPTLYGNFDLTKSPDMANQGNGVWTAVVKGVAAGDHLFKFVTNGKFDDPPDYGSDEVCRPSTSGTVIPVTGQGTAICVTFAAAGNYKVTLDEQTLKFKFEPYTVATPGTIAGTVTFENPPPSPLKAAVTVLTAGTQTVQAADSTESNGSFSIGDLPEGSYDVRFAASGYLDSLKTNVQVAAGQTVNIGTIRLAKGCTSAFSKIQVAGNLNTDLYGNFDLTKSPELQKVAGCRWETTINTVTAGQHFLKLVTNGAFDNPKDYGGEESNCLTLSAGFISAPVKQVSGTGTALCINFPEAGNYKFTLDEDALTLRIEKTVVLQGGTLHGEVAFGGTPPRGLHAAVTVLQQGTSTVVAADSATPEFILNGIPAGQYDVKFAAVGYLDTLRSAVIAVGQITELGTVQMRAGCTSAFNKIQIAGNLNTDKYGNFDLTRAPELTKMGGCRWQATVDSVLSGQHFFKLVTNGAFDSPPDYGGDESNCLTLTAGTLNTTVRPASGTGTALCVTFPDAGKYKFTLDEAARTLLIEKVTSAASRIQTIKLGLRPENSAGAGSEGIVSTGGSR